MLPIVFQILIGVIAGFGWFFCFGHLIVDHFLPEKKSGYSFIFASSLAAAAVSLSIVTIWIPLPFPLLHLFGFAFVSVWLWKKPLLPEFNFHVKNDRLFLVLILFLAVYFILFLGFPDFSFDSYSYHLRFIHDFASFGKIPLPPNPNNWVDYAYVVYPKAIERLFGLAEHFVPESGRLLQFLILLGTTFTIALLGKQFGARHYWLTAIAYLAFSKVYLLKIFYVELAIFFFFLNLVFALNSEKSRHENKFIFLFALAIMLSKINAFSYIIALSLIGWLVYKKPGAMVAGLLAVFFGAAIQFLPPYISGFDLVHAFQLLQATDSGFVLSLPYKLWVLVSAIVSFMFFSPIGFCLLFSLILPVFGKKYFRLSAILLGTYSGFLAGLLASDLYFQVYSIFPVYSMAFIGLGVISTVLFFELLIERFPTFFSKTFVYFLLGVLVVAGFFGAIQTVSMLYSGSNSWNVQYAALQSSIPNDFNTVVFFMNNINTISVGFERAKILDHASFGMLSGDPCDFFRHEGITHVVYWNIIPSTYQLDKGNAKFYLDAKQALLSGRCGTLLSDDSKNKFLPIISEVAKFQNSIKGLAP